LARMEGGATVINSTTITNTQTTTPNATGASFAEENYGLTHAKDAERVPIELHLLRRINRLQLGLEDERSFIGSVKSSAGIINLLFWYHRSDRGLAGHHYGDIYDALFDSSGEKHRCDVREILEIGLGTVDPAMPSSMSHELAKNYRPGPALRVWRDLFPNAFIHGADLDGKAVAEVNSHSNEPGYERIWAYEMNSVDKAAVDDVMRRQIPRSQKRHNFFSQQLLSQNFFPKDAREQLSRRIAFKYNEKGKKVFEPVVFDHIIEDGLHDANMMRATLVWMWPYLSDDDGLYIIEDVPRKAAKRLHADLQRAFGASVWTSTSSSSSENNDNKSASVETSTLNRAKFVSVDPTRTAYEGSEHLRSLTFKADLDVIENNIGIYR